MRFVRMDAPQDDTPQFSMRVDEKDDDNSIKITALRTAPLAVKTHNIQA
jgi:hypothetical protein